MEQTSCTLLLLSFSAAFAKYVYIPRSMEWHLAQEYCRKHHTDLAPISTTYDTERLRQIPFDSRLFIWFGLRRNCTDQNKWMWSGGGEVSTFFWANGQPQNREVENYGLIHDYAWHDSGNTPETFLCYNAIVVREKKTWEQALEHCRAHHQDLASVASDTEMLLIQKKLSDLEATAHVWIGLRFFADGWLWVDGQPLDYEAWGQEGKLQCPGFKRRCGALRVTGRTQSGSNYKSLSLDSVVPWRDGNQEQETCELNTAERDVKVGEWEARDCVEQSYFICY